MDELNYQDSELYLSHVTGAMVVDMDGRLVYMNSQCAEYLGVYKENCLGKPVLEFFPQSKMMEGLELNKTEFVYYHTQMGLGISIHVPIFKENKKIGLLEYDVIQGSEFLYDFADNYKLFLDEEMKYLKREIKHLRSTKYSIENIYGNSPAIGHLKEQILAAARTHSTVLVTGETGTGKELVAHSIHNAGNRSLREFIRINASALPENLFESELFGYEKGSFTGANKGGKKGKFELADKGTLFIDEVNQIPMDMQPKLLRVLQEQEIDRIGALKSTPIDVRIIAATNQDLQQLVNKGKFREDLFYRLDVMEITVPPLRERLEDIPVLVENFMISFNKVIGKNIIGMEPQIYEKLQAYHWPGNIRELHNTIERAMNYAQGDVLEVRDFIFNKEIVKGIESKGKTPDMGDENPIEEAKRRAEKEVILFALEKSKGNKSEAAKTLKISRPLLYQKMKRLGISSLCERKNTV